ncbi:Dynein heavy chain 7, axonemal, partial [Entophlyctis luteolus]
MYSNYQTELKEHTSPREHYFHTLGVKDKTFGAKLGTASGGLIRGDKGVKKDKEHFRTTLVNIVMQSPAQSLQSLIPNLDSPPHESDKDTMQRYYYYISNGIDTQHVAEMEDEWLLNVLSLLSDSLKSNHKSVVSSLSNEMRDDYHMSVKKAIVDFVLKDHRQKNDQNNRDSEGEQSFVKIRQTTLNWSQSFLQAHEKTRYGLFLTNPVFLGILKTWKGYKDIRLFDVEPILKKGGAFELRTFKTMMLQKLEKAHEKMMTIWYPAVLNVFYQGSKKNEWSSIPTERLEAFFRTVSLILADQLRYIVEESVNDFVGMFDGSVVTAAKRVEGGKPLHFSVRLVADKDKIKFEPATTDILSTAESLFDVLLTSIDKIPKIETQLFSNGIPTMNINNSKLVTMTVKSEQCIKVDFEATLPIFTQHARDSLRSNMQRLFESPNIYIAEFDRHAPLITKSLDCEVTEFLQIEGLTHDRMADVMPNTVAEMVNLQKCLDTSRTVTMKALEESVDEAKKRLNFMISYSDLKKEDCDLNSILFSWPQRIVPIFTDGDNILQQARQAIQEELKSRREKLQTEVEGYAKQIDEYHTFSDYTELTRYLKSAQKLQSKMDNVNERIISFNTEEALYGWEATPFPILADAIANLAPFLSVYQTSVDFQRCYHLWMT